jgi:hypothetical protein
MSAMRRGLGGFYVLLIFSSNVWAGPTNQVPEFARDVRPILASHCQTCHGLEGLEGELDLRTAQLLLKGSKSGAVVTPGSAENSLLFKKVLARAMPPKGELPLTDRKIDILRRWIDGGMVGAEVEASESEEKPGAISDEDKNFWSFRKPERGPTPKFRRPDRVRTPVDAFILAGLEEKGLAFSADASRRTLIRRAYLDVIGLPPEPPQVDAFLTDDSPNAYESMIDQLLASPHYGERWGRHWLDAAGYVDVIGADNDAAIIKVGDNKWLYRDYVVESFNEDKSYDAFLAEQIAGDEMVDWRNAEKYTPEIRRMLVATGYLRAAIDDTDQKELNTALIRYRVLDKTLDVLGTGVMGITLGCARCHSHKYEPIPQEDYYRLMALFTPAYNPQNWVTLSDRFLPNVSGVEEARIEAHNARIDGEQQPLRAEIAKIEADQRERIYQQKLAGLPEAIRSDADAALKTTAEKRNEVQRYLASKFEAALGVKPEEMEGALSEASKSRRGELQKRIADLDGQRQRWDKIHALYDVGPAPVTYVLRRGDHETPGLAVVPGFLGVLSENGGGSNVDGVLRSSNTKETNTGTSFRRTALANWLTAPDTPAAGLTARVMVNRIWQHLFGEGIVATPDNFGRSGARPSHPELLDWLAVEFMANGWKIKPMVRLLMQSTAYRQASNRIGKNESTVSEAQRAGPDNQLYWRMRLRRLDSEIVRDAMLAVGGTLDRRFGGAPVPLENRADGHVVVAKKGLPHQGAENRRSLYVLARRNYHLSMLATFDQPAVATNCARRTSSAVVTQSLTLMNDAFVIKQADRFAGRLLSSDASASTVDVISLAFRIAYSREPTAEEIAWSRELIVNQAARLEANSTPRDEANRNALANLCQMLMSSNEFLYTP